MLFEKLSDLVEIIVNVLHEDTMIERLTLVQPSDVKTSNRVNKSIERFKVNVTFDVSSLGLVSLLYGSTMLGLHSHT